MGLFGLGKPNIKKMKAKRDVEGLIKALSGQGWDIHNEAAEALGDIKNPRAIEPLIQALRDDEDRSAARALLKR